MADFGALSRWEKFAPDIGDNRQRPAGERLWLEIKSSMTRLELIAFERALKDTQTARRERAEAYVAALRAVKDGGPPPDADAYQADMESAMLTGYLAALSPACRLVGTHTLGGSPVATLAEYVAAVATLSDGYNLLELPAAVKDANSVGGATQLFSERRSGGWAGTPAPSSAED